MSGVRKLPSGKWQGIARHPSGRRSTKTFTLKGQAASWAADTEAEWRRVGFRDPRAGQVTVSEWHARWQPARLAGRKTLERNEQVWRLYVEPQWGTWPLEAVTRMEVQGWAGKLLAELRERERLAAAKAGREPRTVGIRTVEQAVGLLSMLLQAALDEDPPVLAGRNPCRGVVASLPEAPQRPPVYFTREQADALLAELAEPYRTLVDFALVTGLRWGELGGLHARHLDFLHELVHVRVVLEDDGTLREHPKSKMSRRSLPIPPHLVERMRELAGAAGRCPVFRRPDGGPLDYDRFRTAWDRAVEDARTCRPGAPCRRGGACLDAGHRVPEHTPHATRHTAASWLVMAGVDLYRVQAVLGHESHLTTRRYAHLAPDAHDVVREVWQNFRARSAHEGTEPGAASVRLRE